MRIVFMAVTAVALAFGAGYLAFVQRVDNGYIISFGTRIYDPVGLYREWKNSTTRECSSVVAYSSSSEKSGEIKRHLENASSSGEPTIIQLSGIEGWYLAEVVFSRGEPLVFLLQAENDGYIQRATWGGTNAPFDEAPGIRGYLEKSAPTVPVSLVNCYDPITPPFGPGKL